MVGSHDTFWCRHTGSVSPVNNNTDSDIIPHLTIMVMTRVRNSITLIMVICCNLPCMMSLGSASPVIGNFTSSFNTAPQLTSLGEKEGGRERDWREGGRERKVVLRSAVI